MSLLPGVGALASGLAAEYITTTTLPNLPAATIGCYGGAVNFDDVATAVADMGGACDTGTTINGPDWISGTVAGWIWYSEGDAMSYACSSGGDNPCSSSEALAFTGAILDYCQASNAGSGGYARIEDWAKTYGVTTAGGDMMLDGTTHCDGSD